MTVAPGGWTPRPTQSNGLGDRDSGDTAHTRGHSPRIGRGAAPSCARSRSRWSLAPATAANTGGGERTSAIASVRQAMLWSTFALSLSNFLSRWVCSWSHLHARSRARVRARAVIGCACTAHLDALLVTTPTFDSDEDGSAIFFSRYTTPWGVCTQLHSPPTNSLNLLTTMSLTRNRSQHQPSQCRVERAFSPSPPARHPVQRPLPRCHCHCRRCRSWRQRLPG